MQGQWLNIYEGSLLSWLQFLQRTPYFDTRCLAVMEPSRSFTRDTNRIIYNADGSRFGRPAEDVYKDVCKLNLRSSRQDIEHQLQRNMTTVNPPDLVLRLRIPPEVDGSESGRTLSLPCQTAGDGGMEGDNADDAGPNQKAMLEEPGVEPIVTIAALRAKGQTFIAIPVAHVTLDNRRGLEFVVVWLLDRQQLALIVEYDNDTYLDERTHKLPTTDLDCSIALIEGNAFDKDGPGADFRIVAKNGFHAELCCIHPERGIFAGDVPDEISNDLEWTFPGSVKYKLKDQGPK